MITGIAHNALTVSDMEASVRFYRDVVGRTLAFETPNAKGEPWIVYMKVSDGKFLELFYDGVKDPDSHYAGDLIGYHHFCFEVDDIDEMARKAHAAGALKSNKASTCLDFNRAIWIEDPDGNGVEIVQYMPNSPHMTVK
jgi:catechol 2,3-dioxygenase-like lactoylglutathione lyase family enzyme